MSFEYFQYMWREFIIYAPLGIIGLWRWSVWLFQKILSFRYKPIPHTTPLSPRLSLSIITPVYNEDPALFHAALNSWEGNHPDEIIAVIDESDTTCIGIFKEFQKRFYNATLLVTDVPGKRGALALGTRHATSDILALVDSDTVWDDNIRDILLAPFADEKVGGVGCRQAVIAPKTSAEKLFDIRFSLRYLHEYPYLMSVGDALTCLSGRTAVYRKTALLPILDEMLHETFLWKKCISGEDKRLTSLIMRDGWKVRYQQNATVRTEGMRELRQFFKQNLRWSRNSWRTDLRLIFSSWTWAREPLFAYHLIDRSIQPFTLLLGPIYFFISLYFQHWLASGILLSWWFVSRTIKLYPHLKEKPRDITMVPLFTLAQYHLAVLKLYALLSLDFQSWITRWHSSRLRKGFTELLPSQIATFSLVFGVAYFVFQDAQAVAEAQELKRQKELVPYTENFTGLGFEELETEFWRVREENSFASYISRPRETPNSIMRKFNIPEEKREELFPKKAPDGLLLQGTPLRIPVNYLLNSFSPTLTSATPIPPTVIYLPQENMIHIKGRGSVVRLSSIAKALPPNQQLLVETAPKEWLLRSKLYMSEGVTLIIDGDEAEWLKIQSSSQGFSYIRGQHAGILINNTRITSWNEERNDYDREIHDGRAFIVAYASGRMDIINSDLSYLGFPIDEAKRYQNFGGIYGLSWKLQNGTFGRYLMTGNIINNKIHHNYFGIYTYGTTGMLMKNNKIYENIEYGIDPHDDSNNLFIENNYVHDNGNHGIIGSKRVKYSSIRNNKTVGNRLHGIMLDRQTDYNLVENNLSAENVNGIALSDSHMNMIRHNTFTENRFGIRGSSASSQNFFEENTITENEKGIYLYAGAKRNMARNNTITGNDQGVYLKEARSNAVVNSLHAGKNILTIKFDDTSRISNFIQRIP